MNSKRSVRRAGSRPNYTRQAAGRRAASRLKMPTIQVTWIKIAAVITLILLVFVGAAHITRLQNVTIEGNKALPSDHLTKLANDGINKQWFGKNTFLINTAALENHMEQADPGIKEANASRRLFGTLSVTIEERQPALNWSSGGVVYLLDSDATVLGPTRGVYKKLPTVLDSSNLPVEAGKRVATKAFVSFCSQLSVLLPTAGFQISEMIVPETTSEVYVKTPTGLLLKFDTTRPPGEEVADLKAVKSTLDKAKKTPTEYIDVRIQHKAYYK